MTHWQHADLGYFEPTAIDPVPVHADGFRDSQLSEHKQPRPDPATQVDHRPGADEPADRPFPFPPPSKLEFMEVAQGNGYYVLINAVALTLTEGYERLAPIVLKAKGVRMTLQLAFAEDCLSQMVHFSRQGLSLSGKPH